MQIRWECAVRQFGKPPIHDGKDLIESQRKIWENFREDEIIQVYKLH